MCACRNFLPPKAVIRQANTKLSPINTGRQPIQLSLPAPILFCVYNYRYSLLSEFSFTGSEFGDESYYFKVRTAWVGQVLESISKNKNKKIIRAWRTAFPFNGFVFSLDLQKKIELYYII